jgi:hypothetical protein
VDTNPKERTPHEGERSKHDTTQTSWRLLWAVVVVVVVSGCQWWWWWLVVGGGGGWWWVAIGGESGQNWWWSKVEVVVTIAMVLTNRKRNWEKVHRSPKVRQKRQI